MQFSLYDFAGVIGVCLIIFTYLLLQIDKMDSKSFTFSALNALGAILIIVSLTNAFNLSAFLVELFWLLISVVGIFRSVKKRKQA